MKLSHKVASGLVLVLATAIISGVSNFVNFWAVQGTNSDAFITVRNLLVAALLIPFALLLGRARGRLRSRDWARLAVVGVIGGAVPFLLFFRGLQMAGAAGAPTATFAYRSLFLFATLFAVVFLRERLSSGTFLAAAMLLAGLGLLMSLSEPVWTAGTALVLAATVFWATEYTVSKHLLRDLPPQTVALGRMGFGGVFLLAYLGISGQLPAAAGLSSAQLEWAGVSALLLVGFVSTWYAGLRHVDLGVASAVLVLGFPITWALSVATGRTPVTLPEAAGAAAIAFGSALAVSLVAMRDTWAAIDRALFALARRTPWL